MVVLVSSTVLNTQIKFLKQKWQTQTAWPQTTPQYCFSHTRAEAVVFLCVCEQGVKIGFVEFFRFKFLSFVKILAEMKQLRNSGNRDDEELDTDEDLRYGNGIAVNGNRRSSNRRQYEQHMRHSNTEKTLAAKKRVIRMLFMIVFEFFMCWTPLYVVNTWSVMDFTGARKHISPLAMNFIHLLSYFSSCCNPITYCFMNKKFRQAFLAAFRCRPRRSHRSVWRDASSFGQSNRTGNAVTPNPPYVYCRWQSNQNKNIRSWIWFFSICLCCPESSFCSAECVFFVYLLLSCVPMWLFWMFCCACSLFFVTSTKHSGPLD